MCNYQETGSPERVWNLPEATQQSFGELGLDPILGLRPFTDPHKSPLRRDLIPWAEDFPEETLLPSFSLGFILP